MQDEFYLNSLLVEIQKMFKDQGKKVNVPIEQETKVKIKYSPPGIQVEVLKSPLTEKFLVTRVQALQLHELPAIYVDELVGMQLPKVWQEGSKLVADNDQVLLRVCGIYSYGELKKALLYIELAGRHLTVANRHVKSGLPKWTKCDRITFKDGLLLSIRDTPC